MTDDLISRQAAIDIVTPHDDNRVMRDALEELPSAQPERIKGHWIDTNIFFPNTCGQFVHEVYCDKCYGIAYFRRTNNAYVGASICPNCGTDMTGEQDD